MYTENERKILSISRAVINLKGFYVITESEKIIDDPVIMVNLLSKVELETFSTLLTLSLEQRLEVEEAILRSHILIIVGYNGQKIDLNYTPAGVIATIAQAITSKSEQYLDNENNSMYDFTETTVNYIEEMSAIISYYMNIRYDYVITLPINEIYKRYAICQRAFPHQIDKLYNKTG